MRVRVSASVRVSVRVRGLSRISNLRLVPLADLANSALPGWCECVSARVSAEGQCECVSARVRVMMRVHHHHHKNILLG